MKETAGTYDVISDIDDTIMVSYTADFYKRISTVAFNNPKRRKSILYTYQLLKTLEEQGSRMFYVSKSESNLFGMISSFISHHNFPKGDIFLTPYLRFNQLFRSKDTRYKEDTINFIITNSSKNFILIGDDSQMDMDAYAHTVSKFPDRIFRIYIRQTKKNRSRVQLQKWQDLKATGVNVTYFDKSDVFDKNS